MRHVRIHDAFVLRIDDAWQQHVHTRAATDAWDDHRMYSLACSIDAHWHDQAQAPLLCLAHLHRCTPLPHQVDTARRVIYDMHGCALLADEVGLGKTIEACIVLKEYLMRGIVKKALLLVPASLVMQWVRELRTKFGIDAVAHHRKRPAWDYAPIIVASLDVAKRAPHRDAIISQTYDFLLVDEAHKLNNDRTANYALIASIRRTRCLLLTATPMQNDVRELVHLLNVLHPGYLGDKQTMRHVRKIVRAGAHLLDASTTHTEPTFVQVKNRLHAKMVRNRRDDIGSPLSRDITTQFVAPSDSERAVYDALPSLGVPNALALLTLQREACSSRDALFVALVRMMPTLPNEQHVIDLLQLLRTIRIPAKASVLLHTLLRTRAKTIVFTTYRATQQFLLSFLRSHGWTALPYDGSMSRGKKSWMLERFARDVDVLIATEAGNEGLNVQFCQHLINYDLPWNPMRLEQRIGRIDRIGQTGRVHITNFVTQHTVESHMLELLQTKISYFRHVIGDILPVLTDHAPAQRCAHPPPKLQNERKDDPLLHDVLCTFATVTNCDVIEQRPQSIIVQLTPDMDKQLLGRSWYWAFVARTNAQPVPMRIHWHDPQTDQAPIAQTLTEPLAWDSPSITRLIDFVRAQGTCTRLYAQHCDAPLHPWLVVHWHLNKHPLVSAPHLHTTSIDLVHGTIAHDVPPHAHALKAHPIDHAVHTPPTITLQDAMHAVTDALIEKVRTFDPSWAHEAHTALHCASDTMTKQCSDAHHQIVRLAELYDRQRPYMAASAVRGALYYV
jgi:superfamily II DNA or RNA helicase